MLDDEAPVVISSQTLNRQDGKDEYYVRAAAMGGGVDPRRAEAFESPGAGAAGALVQGEPDHPGLPLRELQDDPGRRRRSCDPHRERLQPVDLRRRGLGQGRLPGGGQAGPADSDHQDGDLPHLARGAGTRVGRSLPAHPGPGAGARRRGRVRRAATVAGRLLGAVGRRGARAARGAAGDSLEPVPGRAGHRPGRAVRRAGQGGDGIGLWRPLLLGHRDLRAAVPDLHLAADGPERAALPLQHARRRPAAGAGPGPERCAVSLADGQRRGGVGVLRRRNRAVSHRRRHRVRPVEVRRSEWRPGVHEPRGRGHHGRDRPDVGRSRVLAGASAGGRTFHVHGVTGPDEYTTVVNDNLFTNVMARFNLDKAADVDAPSGARPAGGVPAGGQAAERHARGDRGMAGVRRGHGHPVRPRVPGSTRRTRTSWTGRSGT